MRPGSRTRGAFIRWCMQRAVSNQRSPRLPGRKAAAKLLSARVQNAVWRRQMPVGHTSVGGDAKQDRDNSHGVAHGPANKRCGGGTQAQAWVVQRKFDRLARAGTRMISYSIATSTGA